MRPAGVALACLALGRPDGPALAQGGLVDADLRGRVNAVLQVLSFAAIPDANSALLKISSGESDDPRLEQAQFGGATTLSGETPIYLEGFLGATQYDPAFVFNEGRSEQRVETRWTGLAATGGVGYDVRLTENLVLRPILNATLGYVSSDLDAFDGLFDRSADPGFDFLDGGDLFALGFGGSVMLDYNLRRDDYELDIELRYTALRLTNVGGAAEAVEGEADGQTAALWARLRYPSGFTAFGAPLRAVFEGAHSSFFGPSRGALGFTDLSHVGVGVEFDTEDRDVALSRTRLVVRYVFGENVEGFGVGVGLSF